LDVPGLHDGTVVVGHHASRLTPQRGGQSDTGWDLADLLG
jgi:hypothetical protein